MESPNKTILLGFQSRALVRAKKIRVYKFIHQIVPSTTSLLFSLNLGSAESHENIHPCKVVEWAVGQSKTLYDRFGSNYDETLISRAMKANNMLVTLKNDLLRALGEEELVSKPSHSQEYFKDVQEELRMEIRTLSPLCSKPEREKIEYTTRFMDLWGELTVPVVSEMIEHKAKLYKGSRLILS